MLKRKAFTIAEVLISLVIIGVVAAITIPVVSMNAQKKKTVVQLRKAYSVIYNAYNLSISFNGPIQTWEFGKNTYDWNTSRKFLEKYLIPYLQVSSDFKYKVGAAAPDQFVFLDGTVLNADVREASADLIIDLNGNRKPNRRGRDIFVIRLSKTPNYKEFGFAGAVYKRNGMINNAHGCSHNVAGNKYTYCGALIQADNWQIKDDYPW